MIPKGSSNAASELSLCGCKLLCALGLSFSIFEVGIPHLKKKKRCSETSKWPGALLLLSPVGRGRYRAVIFQLRKAHTHSTNSVFCTWKPKDPAKT